jgi:hypothetical protein
VNIQPAFRLFVLGGLAALAQWAPVHAATTLPAPYEDLVEVKSRKLDAIYLLPGANFGTYTKIMIDPVQVSFRKGWQQAANRSRGARPRVSDSDAQQIAQAARSGFGEIFTAAFKAKGYDVVSDPAPDVLRLSPSIVNLYINAPRPTTAANRTYTVEAGEATLVLEARDSTTGAILGLAVDRSRTRSTGDATLATPASNRADFEEIFKRWAAICVDGFERLRTTPSVETRTGR